MRRNAMQMCGLPPVISIYTNNEEVIGFHTWRVLLDFFLKFKKEIRE